MNYGFNTNTLIKQLLPPAVRKPKQIAWLMALVKPVQDLHTAFLAYRQQALRDITITSQVNRLTKALQDKFSNDGIYLVHPLDYLDQAYVYLYAEERLPEYDYLLEENHRPKEFDYILDELNRDFDFIVRVPAILAQSNNNITAFVNKYVMAGRRFKIENY